MDELRAKPIWSAAQRAELAALSEQIHAATVAGETEQLRELLPRAAQAVNALILTASEMEVTMACWIWMAPHFGEVIITFRRYLSSRQHTKGDDDQCCNGCGLPWW